MATESDVTMPRQIQEVYRDLRRVLNDPEAFGLGRTVPPQLADALKSMRQKLRAAMRELRIDQSNGDLEEELSEDADRPAGLGTT